MTDKAHFLTHSKISFLFNKDSRDFTVEEVPLYDFSGDGEHIVVKIRKKDTTTWEAVKILCDSSGTKSKEVGYAGMKDKDGLTIQYISMPRICEEKLSDFSSDKIKILNMQRHKNKIKLGHLKGNNFFVRLKKVNKIDAQKMQNAFNKLCEEGMPNYFGYQRFGADGQNHVAGEKIAKGLLKERNEKLRELFLNAYQSSLFNDWLSLRIELSRIIEGFSGGELKKALTIFFAENSLQLELSDEQVASLKMQPQFLRLIYGDALCHYPHGKVFFAEDLAAEAARFAAKQISPTGILSGRKTARSTGMAWELEKTFAPEMAAFGDRRFAWIFPENCEFKYIEENAWVELRFYLPRGSYATTLLDELSGL